MRWLIGGALVAIVSALALFWRGRRSDDLGALPSRISSRYDRNGE